MSTDSDVIRRSRDDPHVFGELFERHARVVHRYIVRRAGVVTADDVVAETFLIAFEQRDRFRSASVSALPWLLGIATNALNAHRRKEARHLKALSRSAEPEGDDGGLDRTADRADAVEAVRLIAARLRALPVGERDVLRREGGRRLVDRVRDEVGDAHQPVLDVGELLLEHFAHADSPLLASGGPPIVGRRDERAVPRR